MRRLLPIEWLALLSLLVGLLLHALFGVRAYFPNAHSATFVVDHYVIGVALSMLVALLRSMGEIRLGDLGRLLRTMLALIVVLLMHFNFKLWAQLINSIRYDELYQWTDQLMAPLLSLFSLVNFIFLPLKDVFPNAYHDVFVFMFFVSFVAHATTRSGAAYLNELVFAVALVLVVGGLAYSLAPAWGPFIHFPDQSVFAYQFQERMALFQERFVATQGDQYAGEDFISPLAAMPSLHVAHVYVLFRYAQKGVPWLRVVYLPLLMFIVTEAVVSRWHYVIDLVFGFFLAIVCIRVARAVYAHLIYSIRVVQK